ncbi:hypothetical protein ASA1KI_12210 [Opitutales bacterium ASA1]|uniref:hypothetical protein n=1 Tax=Congregicoccus parvus TaxID=3081749 RepID=UPI002B2F3899|nr:hypothetical protein ASA1KI_12210 [Opitutales bacterium ASA1]
MNHILTRSLPLALITAGGALVPNAAAEHGLLGTQWASVAYEFTEFESAAFDRSNGFGLVYNRPIHASIDLGFEWRSWERDPARIDVPKLSTDRLMAHATFVGPTVETTPFLRLGLGWAQAKSGGSNDESLMHAVGIGCEWPVAPRVTLGAFADWTDSFDDDIDGVLTYGGHLSYAASERVSLLVRAHGDDHYNVTLGLGALVRF